MILFAQICGQCGQRSTLVKMKTKHPIWCDVLSYMRVKAGLKKNYVLNKVPSLDKYHIINLSLAKDLNDFY